MADSGIRFNDYFFSEPINLAVWTPPKCAGLFSILINDPNWAPRAFQPLYFGEFGNNSPASAVLLDCHTAVAAANGKTLFVAVLPMPFSTTQQRWALRHELTRAYNPVCQSDSQTQPHELATQLAELEKKHHEQTAQMMQLKERMNAPSDAPGTRRRIGFVT
jgi:hypothetical protein